MGRRGKKTLSAEDRALWDKVARTTTPLAQTTRLQLPAPDAPAPAPHRPVLDPAPPRERLSAFRIGEKAAAKPHPPQPQRDLSARLAQAPVRMDHGVYQKLLRGKLKPEARIDLHGMTLAEAHPALIRFIFAAHDAGKRLVLVITGKGRDRDTPDPIPVRRGVLRHQVPGWLNAPPLGALVLDIREAHQRHGGGGAFYVYLRKSR